MHRSCHGSCLKHDSLIGNVGEKDVSVDRAKGSEHHAHPDLQPNYSCPYLLRLDRGADAGAAAAGETAAAASQPETVYRHRNKIRAHEQLQRDLKSAIGA